MNYEEIMDQYYQEDFNPFKKEKLLVRTMECATCTKVFNCNGHPKEVDNCLMYEERKDNGRS